MNIREVQDEIIRLKKEKDICILAHSYQAREILEVADFTGDSYALSKMAKTAPNKTVIMCGVRFMAETVKMLSPEKRVILSNGIAGCPMAEQFDREIISQMKEMYPDYTVVAYINTTAELKTVCDVCVTSSSAECQPQVTELADYVGSTSGIMNYAKNSDKKEFIIGTENSIAEHLQYECPDKKFYLLSKSLICENMKSTTLIDVLNCCKGEGGEEIELSPETIEKAVKCINKMIEFGG